MYEVLVNGLELTGRHGVTEEERSGGCRLKIDVCAEVDGSADDSDDIGCTVDYGELAGLMVEVSGSASYRTLERLANVFCEEAFRRFPLLVSVEVQIDKLEPPVPFTVGSLGVRLTMSRPG
ncbi:MAG: dihydroneopterin aldolase [Armatimonadetes bacterium]|nr:dihydroneopterin aldolase [Armatimonadota bacterium]